MAVKEFGVVVAILLLIAYTLYENRLGTIAQAQRRLKALGVITYRLAQESDEVDESAVREEVYDNGGSEDIFPGDFTDDGVNDRVNDRGEVRPDGGGPDG